MARILKHWKLMITTQEIIQHGGSPLYIGISRTGEPVIEHGFLMYENHNGCLAGVNLSGVLLFSIEPEFEE